MFQHPQEASRWSGRIGDASAYVLRNGFEQAVDRRAFCFAQLEQVLGLLDAGRARAHPAGHGADGALLRQAALALQEQLDPSRRALAALRSTSAAIRCLRFLGEHRCVPRETSLTPRISSPAAWSDRIAVAAGAGALDEDLDLLEPLMPLRYSVVRRHLRGERRHLREPLNPAEPADSLGLPRSLLLAG